MNKNLSALNQQLAEKNQQAHDRVFKSPKYWAETAPMPEDPEICRWCGRRLKSLLPGVLPVDYCESGCETNHADTFTRQCHDCRKEFKTGSKNAVLCYGCDQKDKRAVEDPMRADPSYGFHGKKDPIRPLKGER